jgi:hypothetical protein
MTDQTEDRWRTALVSHRGGPLFRLALLSVNWPHSRHHDALAVARSAYLPKSALTTG